MTKLQCCAPEEPSFSVQTNMGYPQQNGDRVQLLYSLHALPLDLWRGMQDGFGIVLWNLPVRIGVISMVPDACFKITCTETVS